MPLTKEQLLIPRYKVIALWPFEYVSRVGDIHHQPDVSRGGQWTALWSWWDEMGKHPHLFQPLSWWSDREICDLPEYVKRCDGSVVRVLHYGYSEGEGELYLVMDDLEIPNYMDYLDPQPSNLEEYTAYINQKQQ